MSHAKPLGLILAVQPTSRGFGWALFEGALVPVDWGIATPKGNRSEQCLLRFKKLLDQYQPTALVLEKFEKGDSRRGERIRELAQTMRGFANSRDMDTPIYGRAQVNTVLVGTAKVSRHAAAQAVAERLPILRERLPKARMLWQPEDGRQCLFDAAALGITHYALTHSRS